MPPKKIVASSDANKTSGTSPTPATITPRGLRIEAAASYSGLSPFFLEEIILLSFSNTNTNE